MGTVKTLSTRAAVVKRSAGGKAVAASAYRAGERLVEHETGRVWDYSDKPGVEEAFILAPEKAGDWAKDRETLWNTVERTETRVNAQLARDVRVGLPVEMGREARGRVTREIVGEAFVARGMVADVAVHLYSQAWKEGRRGTAEKVAEWRSLGYEFMSREESAATVENAVTHPHVMVTYNRNGQPKTYQLFQPHFHALMTMRPLSADGQAFGAKKDVRDWNDRTSFDALRGWIAAKLTDAAKLLGELLVTVEHRSYEGRRAEAAEKAEAARAEGRADDAAKFDKLERRYAAKATPYLGAATKVQTPNTRMADRLASWVEAKHSQRVAGQAATPMTRRSAARVAGAVRSRQAEKPVARPVGRDIER